MNILLKTCFQHIHVCIIDPWISCCWCLTYSDELFWQHVVIYWTVQVSQSKNGKWNFYCCKKMQVHSKMILILLDMSNKQNTQACTRTHTHTQSSPNSVWPKTNCWCRWHIVVYLYNIQHNFCISVLLLVLCLWILV